ncbi:MAG: pullulanase [Spirochaetes bacterium]|uniref:Pullulanase n=1 Tax=Candidatus Gallitreponema excrementavium TaxID=2840840 RepID=A0A9D9HQN3_9SPIR|nr:pullulanase [Candidatus Gallitreponema excrementavium]
MSHGINSEKKEFDYKQLPIPLGKTVLGVFVIPGRKPVFNFSLWAPTSSSVTLNIYKKNHSLSPWFSLPMTYNRESGIWSTVYSKKNIEGCFYDYTVTNSLGTNNVLDPYACSMEEFLNDDTMGRGAIIDFTSKKLKSKLQLEDNRTPFQDKGNAVVYEISVRDFTISGDSGVKNIPGTYEAFIEKLPYLRELGITHIQLMPVLNFYNNNETKRDMEATKSLKGNNYNWGYDPHNYFTPEGWYSKNPGDPYSRVKGLQELVTAAHSVGLRVILDVVYNHMAKVDFLEKIVPGYYFRMNPDGSYKSNSGCGNDLATERDMTRRLIVDSTVHFVKNYGVDGFRFDLMGLIDTETILEAYASCMNIDPQVLFIGEGWSMYDGEPGTRGMDQQFMSSTSCVSVFNDEFRDLLKAGGMYESGTGFLTGKDVNKKSLFMNLTGRPHHYGCQVPYNNVQYMVCHDGLTLHDSISANLNLDPEKPEEKKEIFARIRIGNFLLATSQGIMFLHGGQERGRSKPGFGAVDECVGPYCRNTYKASDLVNQFLWTLDEEKRQLLEYTKSLINLRKSFGIFNLGSYAKIEKNTGLADHLDKFMMGYYIKDEESVWYILANTGKTPGTFKLMKGLNEPRIYADTVHCSPVPLEQYSGITIEENRVTLEPLSCALIRFVL